MIRFVCPACGRSMDTVQTKIVITAFGSLRVVPGSETGVDHAINSPTRVTDNPQSARVIPKGPITCSRCGKSFPLSKWTYLVSCDNCGDVINPEPITKPGKVVDAHVCRDTKNISCKRCWKKTNTEYCPECRFRDTCIPYNR